MKRLATASLPVAIGAGIQVSGIGGTVASIVTWTVVAAALLVLAIHTLRQGHDPDAGTGDIGTGSRTLGKAIASFSQTRQATAPSYPADARPWGRALFSFASQRQGELRRAYDADTVSLFVELFGARVAAMIERLRRAGRIGFREAQALGAPSCPTEIERLGQRLIELGYRSE